MSERLHEMETYEREDGKRGWRITVGDDVVATDGGQGYNNEEDCLAGLFGLFFGTWDESFLGLYEKWQSYSGQQGSYDTPAGSVEGPPVHMPPKVIDVDAPNYQADLGDDPDGDASVDPRDT